MDGRVGSRAPLVGRETELGRVRQALEDAAAGRGSSWFVVGEPGSGKTRLAAELLEEAWASGFAVLAGGASGVLATPAYGLVAQTLRSQLRGSLPRDPALDPYAPGLAAILPEWSSPPSVSDFTVDQRRLLAAEGTFQLLLGLARPCGGGRRRRGVVVCFDDLQWADPESLEVVHHLAVGVGDSPIVLLGAVRLGEHSPAEALARRLAQQRDAELLELPPLSLEDLRTLVGVLLAAPAPDPLVTEVAHRSAGLPLFVEELVDAYLAAGVLAVRDGAVRWSGPSPEWVPPSMASWVASRLARLGPEARAVVAAAAVLGRFDRSLAELANLPPKTVEEALGSAIDAGLIDRVATELRFHHDLVRDAVAQSLLPSKAEALHRRAAETLERHGAAPEERAHHLEAVGERESAAGLLVQAARSSLDAHALASAGDLASRALRLAPAARSAADAREVLAASLAGQGRWSEALDLDRQLVAAGRTDASVLGRMAATALHAGRVEEAAAVLSSDAARALPNALRDRLQATVALARGQLASAAELAEGASRDALAQGDVDNACASLDVLGRVLDLLGRHEEAADAFRRWAALAEEAGLVSSRLHALVSLGGHQLLRGLPAPALWEARALGLQARSYLQLGWAELSLAYAVQFTRPAAEAIALADAAVGRARRFRLDVLPHLLVAAAGAHYPLDPRAGERLLGEALQLRPADDDLAIIADYGRGLYALYDGRYGDAAAHWERCVEGMRGHRGGTPNDAPAGLPVALLAAGRKDDAIQALVAARQWPIHVFEYTFQALTTLADALLNGHTDQVIAAVEPMRGPEPFYRAGTLVAAAEISADPVRVSWLREALDQFTWGGWERTAARVRRLLRAAGAPVPRARRSAAAVPDTLRACGVTRREADILALLAAGLTNADIAAQLHLSVRTVESHVSSLLAKLGARNRTDLAARHLELQRREGR
jgi:DNA-binding CsgD family transcriptional regulator/tetratricopeptide (TPR) repeat protein